MTEILDEIEVDTNGVQALLGRTITAVHRDPPSGKSWEFYEETLTLTLDDGSIWKFRGQGYDASSLEIFVINEGGIDSDD